MASVPSRLVRKYGLSKVHKIALELIGKNKKVLEIGCSSGYLTKIILRQGCTVDAVEINKEDALQAQQFTRKIIIGSIEDKKVLRQLRDKYDVVLLLDVLEHLIDPKGVLVSLKTKIKRDGRIIASIPNIASWPMRKELLFGKFEYQKSGLLDQTHLRFFSYNSFLKLVRNSGYKVDSVLAAYTRVPFEYSIKKLPIVNLCFEKYLRSKIVKRFPNLCHFHFVTVCKLQKND